MTTAASADDGTPAPRTTQRARRQPVPEAPLARDPRQPLLHDHVVVAAAPSVLLCDRSGDLDALAAGEGAQGLFHADIRALSRLRLTVGNEVPDSVLGAADGAGRARFVGFARNVGDRRSRPQRARRADARDHPGRLRGAHRRQLLGDHARHARTSASRSAPTCCTSTGSSSAPSAGRPARGGPAPGLGARRHPRHASRRRAATSTPAAGTLVWQVDSRPGGRAVLEWQVASTTSARRDPAARGADLVASPRSARRRPAALDRLLRRCLADLHGLRMATPESPDDVFLAAGAPWFFTLFGRDSLWAARMLLPLGTDLARGTLRTLAARQGTRTTTRSPRRSPARSCTRCGATSSTTAQACGSRRSTTAASTPPRCGSACCTTPGAGACPPRTSSRCCPHLEAALGWLEATDRGDGLPRATAGATPTRPGQPGLEGLRRRRPVPRRPPRPGARRARRGAGLRARGGAVGGAELLDAFGRPGARRLARLGRRLADRFRPRSGSRTPTARTRRWPSTASGRPVDAVASNMGHLLGTGLLDAAETDARRPAARRRPSSPAAYGLRTMSSASGGYGPLALPLRHGLAARHRDRRRSDSPAAGTRSTRVDLIEGLLAAGAALPGSAAGAVGRRRPRRGARAVPTRPPAARRPGRRRRPSPCSTTVLGLEADVPAGTLAVRPVRPSPVGAVHAWGLRVAGSSLAVETDSTGALVDVRTDAPLSLVT